MLQLNDLALSDCPRQLALIQQNGVSLLSQLVSTLESLFLHRQLIQPQLFLFLFSLINKFLVLKQALWKCTEKSLGVLVSSLVALLSREVSLAESDSAAPSNEFTDLLHHSTLDLSELPTFNKSIFTADIYIDHIVQNLFRIMETVPEQPRL